MCIYYAQNAWCLLQLSFSWSILCLLLNPVCVTSLREGDYIQVARKAQFHETRTNWHDLLGTHSPRFGQERLVAIPLHKPQEELKSSDDYKLQFAFDGERHVTPWLTILGKHAPEVPLISIEITRAGTEIIKVSAEVSDAPAHYKERHALLGKEFRNVTSWPKHVLLHYTFESQNDVDLDRGLYALFILCLSAAVVLALTSTRGLQAKLAAFLADMAGEEVMTAVSWKGSKEG